MINLKVIIVQILGWKTKHLTKLNDCWLKLRENLLDRKMKTSVEQYHMNYYNTYKIWSIHLTEMENSLDDLFSICSWIANNIKLLKMIEKLSISNEMIVEFCTKMKCWQNPLNRTERINLSLVWNSSISLKISKYFLWTTRWLSKNFLRVWILF